MEKKIIHLQTREELNIYMSPVRQELMHTLYLAAIPQTAKALADRLHISPSSAQHHLKKLLNLGVVEIDHKSVINGITATYYRPASVEVRIGLEEKDGFREQREALTTGIVNQALQGFLKNARELSDLAKEQLPEYGNLFSGVAHLEPEARKELFDQIKEFLLVHDIPTEENSEHWAFVLLAYRERGEERNTK